VMSRLRAECPWDRKQDHQSLRKYLLEEAYEVLEAIDSIGRAQGPQRTDISTPEVDGTGEVRAGAANDEVSPVSDNEVAAYQDLEEELGDLWFQILFHSVLASEKGHFSVVDVAKGMSEKMIRRHPHVFDTNPDAIDGSTVENWDLLKQQEKQRSSGLDGIPPALPALALADKTLSRGSKEAPNPDLGQLGEKLVDAFDTELSGDSATGELLLVLVELARQRGVNAELALRGAIAEAAGRFRSDESAGQLDGSWVLG